MTIPSFRQRRSNFIYTMRNLIQDYAYKDKHYSLYCERVAYGLPHEEVTQELADHILKFGDDSL